MSVRIEIVCDGCGCANHASMRATRFRLLRAHLSRENGWAVSLPGGRDLCASCRVAESKRGRVPG